MVQAKRLQNFNIQLSNGSKTIVSEPEVFNPHQLLESALAACTSMTVQMYAARKEWPLESCNVEVQIVSEGSGETVMTRKIEFQGITDEEQKKRLFDIANKCPLHKILTGKIIVNSELR